MTSEEDALLAALSGQLDDNAVLQGANVSPAYENDATSTPGTKPAFVLRPRNDAQLSAMLAACDKIGQPVAVQGGRTGLSGGARPCPGEVAISLERMTAVCPIDTVAATVTAEAGAPLETVQQRATEAGLLFGVDIGSRGTATIGGMAATNAGGIRVLRYGMFRAQVLGLEAVLADGSQVSALSGIEKDNSGYNLTQMLIGSEGTLGVITKACLKLHAAPRVEMNALIALASADMAMALLTRLRCEIGAMLSAFELILPAVYEGAVGMAQATAPLKTGAGCYVIAEIHGQNSGSDENAFEAALMTALEDGLIADAVLSRSISDMQSIWRLRENSSAFIFTMDNIVGFDIALPLTRLASFLTTAPVLIRQIDASAELFVFGHLGDGNLHFLVQSKHAGAMSRAIYAEVAANGGSISAEHGIGLDKKAWLPLTRSAASLAAMQRIKRALDPKLIMNRGRIFDMPPPQTRELT